MCLLQALQKKMQKKIIGVTLTDKCDGIFIPFSCWGANAIKSITWVLSSPLFSKESLLCVPRDTSPFSSKFRPSEAAPCAEGWGYPSLEIE